MKIGIPKAMLYYKYKVLWETFFTELGCKLLISDKTNKRILEDGINYSDDESCLPSKIFMGHVYSLIDKCDYIFIPRFCSFKNTDVTCVKFNALYDICFNVFEKVPIITYNLDYLKGKNELWGFLKLGKQLGFSYNKSLKAYKKAVKTFNKESKIKANNQEKLLDKMKEDTINILIVSHPYITHDQILGIPIINYFKSVNVNLIYADLVDEGYIDKGWQKYSKSIYWKDNKVLLSGIDKYFPIVDGIVFISVFSCGPDSLVTELCLRRIKNKACLHLVLDELSSDTGMQTRLESFLDILTEKKRGMLYG